MQPPPGSPVGPDAVGARVVVRRRDTDGRVGDVLGVLLAVDAERLVVQRRDGAPVTVPAAAVLAARVVPPAGVTARGIRLLEEVAARGWPGVEQERLGGWLLRAGHGFTGRANSVLPLGDPQRPLPGAVQEVERWYAERGLSPRAQLPDRIGDALDASLAARGWTAYAPTVVVVADLRPELVASAADVHVAAEPDEAWLTAYRYRGRPPPPAFRDVLRAGDGLGFAALGGRDGRPAAIARASVVGGADGTRWVGVTALEVVPGAQRQGLGRQLVTGLLGWAADRGAVRAYAQVAADNTVGRAFWDALGLAEHHRYHYRARPAAGSGA